MRGPLKLCVNGCGVPPQKPSWVLCKKCLDALTRRPKASRKRQRDEADRLFSLIIRTRDDWQCRFEEAHNDISILEAPQCAHIVSRRYLAVRWDEDNAVCLCQRHHMKYTHDPIAWEAWVEERWPGRLAVLKRVALAGPAEKIDYDSLLASLCSRLEELKARR
jgi:hypothetical protein